MEQEIKQQDQTILTVGKAGLLEWIGRILIALLAWLAVKIYDKTNEISMVQPMIQFRLDNLEKKVERMDNKVFTDDRFQYQYAPENRDKKNNSAQDNK